VGIENGGVGEGLQEEYDRGLQEEYDRGLQEEDREYNRRIGIK
jgi:hypothetical protein